MLSDNDFVRQSLELNLFFLRILKEHALFMEGSFMKPNKNFAFQAEKLKNTFTELLKETSILSRGILSTEALNSGEFVTELTFKAERDTEKLTGIEIDSSITEYELRLTAEAYSNIPEALIRQVEILNSKASNAAGEIICFKATVLQSVNACKMATTIYPMMLEHILREACLFNEMLIRLQNRQNVNPMDEFISQEIFWNDIMGEHAEFLRGLLDPSENKLFALANEYAKEFHKLEQEAKALYENEKMLPEVTEESLKETMSIKDFKKQGAEGILSCKVKSIILPLLADHVLREANHFIRLLKHYKTFE